MGDLKFLVNLATGMASTFLGVSLHYKMTVHVQKKLALVSEHPSRNKKSHHGMGRPHDPSMRGT